MDLPPESPLLLNHAQHLLLLLLRHWTVNLLQQLLLRLILAHDHLIHVPAIETIAVADQLTNQLEGSLVLRVQHHSLHDRLQTEVIHVDIKRTVQRGDGGIGLSPLQVVEVGEVEVLRLVAPDVLTRGVELLRLVSDVDFMARNRSTLLQRKVVVVGVASLAH